MASLYEIDKTRLDFLDAVASGEIPEDAVKDTLDSLNGDFETKADDYACYIKSLLSDAQAILEESKNLAERARAKKHKADVLTNYLYNSFKSRGKTKLETKRNLMKIRKTPSSVCVDDDTAFICWAQSNDKDDFLNFKDPTINKIAIKAALKAGEKIPHAQLVSSEKLMIK